ncbi:MAG: ABC transporter permease [Azoarcus sp.]|jgi:putative ABC transport system permease protein|nr:ABC transporter permease [Azoarcus sp.]
MFGRDLLRFALRALTAHKLRAFLTLLGIAVGIAAVILLTAIGEGLHRYVLGEFNQFGTNFVAVTPGKLGTRGGVPGMLTTARDLTQEDAEAIARLPLVTAVSATVNGNAEVRANGRVRRTLVNGCGADTARMYSMTVLSGAFLPADGRQARALVVLGATVKRELFGNDNALGARIDIGGERYRVIGVMAPKGQVLGFDVDDAVYIPTSRALMLFNRSGASEIGLTHVPGASPARVVAAVRETLVSRHGREDFAVTSQQEMIDALSQILDMLTMTVGALGAISLLVGAVGIVTMMTIAVTERTAEIGLLVALGARRRTVQGLFLAEAVAVAALGGVFGLVVGLGLAGLLAVFMPDLPVATPWSYVLAAEICSALIGLAAGVLPARRAAQLNVIDALRAE